MILLTKINFILYDSFSFAYIGEGNTSLLTTSISGGLCSVTQPSASLANSSTALSVQSEALLKASSSPTMSFMFPTVLTSTPHHGDALRQTSVAFLTPTGELDRSCTATLATAGPDGGFILNSVGGDTVYLEPVSIFIFFSLWIIFLY